MTRADLKQTKKMPDELAMEAYQNGYYIEAIQILHAWLENQAQSYVCLIGAVHFEANMKETWDIADSFKFHQSLKFLFVMNHITKQEFDSFKELNSLRNKIMHDLYKEPYSKKNKSVSKDLYDKIFKKTMEQAYYFTRKAEEIIED
jgi:hypothetical protein